MGNEAKSSACADRLIHPIPWSRHSDRRKAWKYLEVGWQDRFYMKIMKQW